MVDTTRTVDIIFKGTDQLSPKTQDIEEALGGIGEEASQAEEDVEGLGEGISGLGDGAAIVGKLQIAFAALAGSVVASNFFDANASYQQFFQSIKFSLGSLQAAQDEFDFITDASERFGVELLKTGQAYSKFVSKTVGQGLEIQQVRDIFTGVAGAISAVGGSSADVAGALEQLGQGIGKSRFELEDLKGIADRVPKGLFGLADALGITTEKLYEQITAGQIGTEQILTYADALNKNLGGQAFDSLINNSARFTTAIEKLNIAVGNLGIADQLGTDIEFTAKAVDLLADGIDRAGGSTDVFKSAAAGLGPLFPVYQLLASGVELISDNFSTASEELREVEVTAKRIPVPLEEIEVKAKRIEELKPYNGLIEGAKEAQVETAKTLAELEKIASNERIKNIEAKVKLDVAQLEKDTKIAVAVIDNLGESIQGTADLLGGLFSDLGGADSLREKFQIEKQIDLENDRRQQQLDQQKILNDAQIRKLNAETKALREGNPVITVNGDGLQPHLEAFMFEILERIQVRINADGLQQLMGVG